MNIDQETFLSAYLDGELAPGPREGLESSLAADPRLAEDLRALTAVRGLIAGLSRPSATVDLSALVLARIDRRRRAGLALPRGLVAAFPIRGAAMLATAAALFALSTVGLFEAGRAPVGRRIVQGLPRPVASRPEPTRPEQPLPSVVSAPLRAPADELAPGREDRQRAEELQSVQRLLDSPALHKVFVVTDVLGGAADQQVGEILQNSGRRHSSFGRITVTQGIVIDPEHPGKATVYAVVVDDRELGLLREQLNKAFPTTVKETEPRAEVVTQLANIGQVSVFPGIPVADLLDPKVAEPRRAMRSFPGLDHVVKGLVFPLNDDFDPLHDPGRFGGASPSPSPHEGPTPEQMRSGPHPSVIDRAPVADASERAKTEPSRPSPPSLLPRSAPRFRPGFHVVLVWVASAAGREGG